MFNQQKKEFNVYRVGEKTNEWNENVKEWSLFCTATVFISLATHNPYNANDLNLMEATHIGITDNRKIKKGMLIDKKYRVIFVNDACREVILYLQEVD